MTFSNVDAFINGYCNARNDIEGPCYEAFAKGDKKHRCGLPGCGEKLSAEQEAYIKEVHAKMDLLDEQMGKLVKELEDISLEMREKK